MIDLIGENTFPVIKIVTSVSTWIEIRMPGKATKVTVGSSDKDLYVSFVGTDGGGVDATDKAFIKKDGYLGFFLGQGTNQHGSVFIAVKTGTTAETVLIFEE